MASTLNYALKGVPPMPEDFPAEDDRNFAINLREYRELRGLTQDAVAHLMDERGFGFTQTTVWKIEQGKRMVRVGEAIALATAVGAPSWRDLARPPAAVRQLAQIDRAQRRAYDTYAKLKDAAEAYLAAQDDLSVSIREATDDGLPVPDMHRSWLATPPEQAVFEIRFGRTTRDDYEKQIVDQVDQLFAALRDRGLEPVVAPEAWQVNGEIEQGS